jgi:hypothetical protein
MILRALAFFLLLLPGVLRAQDDSKSPDVGIKFPETLAGMVLVEVTDYEKQTPGLGVGVSYRAEKQKADLYIYNGGLKHLPDGIDSVEVQQHFKQIIGDIVEMEKQGHYQNVKIVSFGDKTEIGIQPFLHAEVRFTQQTEDRISHVYLTVLKNRFLKIRFTYFASEDESGKRTLEALLKSLGTALAPRPG